MKIGTIIHIAINDPISEKRKTYRSKIIDKDDQYLFIDLPINKKTNRMSFIPDGTRLHIVYVDAYKDLYSFTATLIKRVHLNIPALAITYPNKESIKKIQRRKFFRVQTAIDVQVSCQEDTFPTFTTNTVDLSGGGLAMVKPEEIDLNLNQNIIVQFELQMGPEENSTIKTKAKVVRVVQSEQGICKISVAFTSLSNNDEQNIVQFCFEKQREERLSISN